MKRYFRKLWHYYSVTGLRGVMLFCWGKVVHRNLLVTANFQGIPYPLKLRLGTTDVSVARQVLIEKHYDFEMDFTPRTIIDAGANIGLSAVYFANRFPGAQIVALEPEASNYELLKWNTRYYSNIAPMFGALWNVGGEIVLEDPGHGHHGFQTRDGDGNLGVVGTRVRAWTVLQLIEERNWSQVDLLKVDIEGAEREVFSDSSAWIARTRAIMIELHESMRGGCEKTFKESTADFSRRATRGESTLVSR
jgi:FkbM family methyltransferase